MPSPSHRFSRLQLTIALLLYGSLLIKPIDSAAAEQKTSIEPMQKATKFFVEPFTTAVAANLPENHLDVATLLTEAIRKQLDNEHRLQAEPRLSALKLVGVVLSYTDSLLNVQAELYDGKQYLAYSRVERQLDPAGDWLEDIDLIAEQLLDELIDELRKPQQQGNSQRFNISPNYCFNRHSYTTDPACNNSYYSGWGWWRQYDGYPPRNHKDHRNHDQFRVRDEPHHEHDEHRNQHEHHQEKHHWVYDASNEHHHKFRRIEHLIPVPLNTNLGVEKTKSVESEKGVSQELHHHVREARQDSSSEAVLKPGSVEPIDSSSIPNPTPRHVHQSVQSSNATSQKAKDSSSAPLPNISGTIPKTESIIVNKDKVVSESIPMTPDNQDTAPAAVQNMPEQKTRERHHHEAKWADTRYEQSVPTGSAPTPEVSQALPQAIATPVLQPTSTSSSSSGTENLTPSVNTSVSNASPASSPSSVSTDSSTTTGSSSSNSFASTPSYSSESSSSPSSSSSSYASDSGSSSESSSSSTSSYNSTPSYSSPVSSSSSETGSSSSSSFASTPAYSSESSSSPSSSSSSYSTDSGSFSGSSSSSTSSYSSTPSYSGPVSSSSSETSSGNASSPSPTTVESPPKPEPVKQEETAGSITAP